MGMGGFSRPGQGQATDKAPEMQAHGSKGSKGSQAPPAGGESSRPQVQSKASGLWNAGFGFGKLNPSEAVAERQRRKTVIAEKQEEDDKHIRFTIGGVGRRLTKADFIKEMRELEDHTRQRVVDASSASHAVKTLAKMDPPRRGSSADQTAVQDVDGKETSTDLSSQGGRAGITAQPPARSSDRRHVVASSSTAVEDDTGETPAERRRREAALGMTSQDEDSDDEGTPRVPPSGTRNIRFADTPERGRTK